MWPCGHVAMWPCGHVAAFSAPLLPNPDERSVHIDWAAVGKFSLLRPVGRGASPVAEEIGIPLGAIALVLIRAAECFGPLHIGKVAAL
eukprot:681426-Heterocapsa_arctica.AAC.1